MPFACVEPGCYGRLFSLNFIPGGLNRGRGLEPRVVSVADSLMVQILGANPARSWALISNPNATAVSIYIGNQSVVPVILTQYGVLQIDVNLPWSGEVFAYQVSGGAVDVNVIEAAVQQ